MYSTHGKLDNSAIIVCRFRKLLVHEQQTILWPTARRMLMADLSLWLKTLHRKFYSFFPHQFKISKLMWACDPLPPVTSQPNKLLASIVLRKRLPSQLFSTSQGMEERSFVLFPIYHISIPEFKYRIWMSIHGHSSRAVGFCQSKSQWRVTITTKVYLRNPDTSNIRNERTSALTIGEFQRIWF